MKLKEFLSFWNNNYELYAIRTDGNLAIRNSIYDLNLPFATTDKYKGTFILTDEDIALMVKNKSYLDLIPDSNFESFLNFSHIVDKCILNKDIYTELRKKEITTILSSIDRDNFYTIDLKLEEIGLDMSNSDIRAICELLKGNDTLDFSDIKEAEKEESALELE